jgi:hypothetical protein
VLWLVEMGVDALDGLARALDVGKRWEIYLLQAEQEWVYGMALEEREGAIEEVKGFAHMFCEWGAGIWAQRSGRV